MYFLLYLHFNLFNCILILLVSLLWIRSKVFASPFSKIVSSFGQSVCWGVNIIFSSMKIVFLEYFSGLKLIQRFICRRGEGQKEQQYTCTTEKVVPFKEQGLYILQNPILDRSAVDCPQPRSLGKGQVTRTGTEDYCKLTVDYAG